MKPAGVPALTGLRFLAAATVVWGHVVGNVLVERQDALSQALAPTWFASRLGMVLFFVLSGFVIHYNYGGVGRREPGALRSFAVARLARLYPLYFFMLVFDLEFFSPSSSFPPSEWLPFLTLTQSWLPLRNAAGVYLFGGHVGLAWSISTEIFLYIWYAAVASSMIGALRTPRAVLIAIGGLCLMATAFYGTLLPRADKWGHNWDWLWYVSPYCRIPEFTLGALVARLYQVAPAIPSRDELRVGRLVAGTSVAWIVGLLVLALVTSIGKFWILSWMLAPGCAGVIWYCSRYTSAASRPLRAGPILLLGEASYGIYLWQSYIMSLGHDRGGSILVTLALIALLALGTYQYLEVPARRAIRAALAPRPVTARIAEEVEGANA